MLVKTIVSIVLSLTIISCFADSGGNDSKPLIDDVQKKMQSSAQNNSQSQSAQSNTSSKNGVTQSAQDSDEKEEPPIIEYCRLNPC